MEQGIVVGVKADGAGAAALRWAVREACVRQLPLTAVRAWMPTAVHAYGAIGMLVPGGDGLEAETLAAEQLKRALELVEGSDTLISRSQAVLGSPAQALLEAGKNSQLLVVGTRGASALSRLVLGSVTSSVLHHARTPVAVVPERPERTTPPERVLVGFDASAAAILALQFAADFARRHHAVLIPVLVREQLWVEEELGPATQVRAAAQHQSESAGLRVAVAATLGKTASRDARPVVVTGQVAERLTELATSRDVLVLGSRGRGGFTGLLLGSTSTQCAQHAVCPVVVVRDGFPRSDS